MLAAANAQLLARYTALAALRRPLGNSVYAIEHDLPPDAVAALKGAASQALRHEGLQASAWLVWIALAAEGGYAYAGDEFWPQLEQSPQEWRPNDRRDTLRHWYRQFQKRFHGPVPVGRWAEHFSIIAWPVVNAVLPIYLQTLFARHLYDFREEIAERAATDPASLGRLLSQRYSGNSSRLEDFLEQEELTSRIVLALRDDDQPAQEERLSSTVLSRMVTDLGQRREAREYLAEARNTMRAGRVRFRGRSGRANPTMSPDARETLTPRLVGRITGDGVALGVALPQWRAVLARSGFSSDALKVGRVRFVGDGERWSPASALLTWADRERPLTGFPKEQAALFELSGVEEQLIEAIRASARIEERPLWLLRRQADGVFREILGGQLRARQAYLLICRAPIPDGLVEAAGLVAVAMDGEIFGYSFEADLRIDGVQRAGLEKLGLGVVLGAVIDPAGINPRVGTGGRRTWLSTETITFRAGADFAVASYHVVLDGALPQAIRGGEGPLLFSLGRLAIGSHTLSITALPVGQPGAVPKIKPAEYSFDVVPPAPWPAAMRQKAGFRLLAAPHLQLDDLLMGRVGVAVLGPAGRNAVWSLELFDAGGHPAAGSPGQRLPVSALPKQVGTVIAKLADGVAAALEDAHRVDVVATIEELGRQSLAFKHVVQPLRWVYDAQQGRVRLIDETAHDQPIIIQRYDLAAPLKARALALDAALEGVATEPPGGLFVAKRGKRSYSLFVTARSEVRLESLAALNISQSLTAGGNSARTLRSLVRGLRRWRRARCAGPLALLRKSITLERIGRAVRETCTGPEFARTLVEESPIALTRAQQLIAASPGFGHRMRTFAWPQDIDHAAREFHRFAKLYRLEADPSRCRDALTLAFDPAHLKLGSVADDEARFAGLLANPALLQGAFLAEAARATAQTHAEAVA